MYTTENCVDILHVTSQPPEFVLPVGHANRLIMELLLIIAGGACFGYTGHDPSSTYPW